MDASPHENLVISKVGNVNSYIFSSVLDSNNSMKALTEKREGRSHIVLWDSSISAIWVNENILVSCC